MHTYLITGAARGIGLAIAQRLAQQAQQHQTPLALALLDQAGSALDEVAQQLQSPHIQTLAIAGDLADPSCPSAAVQACHAAFGQISGIVSNAGAAVPSLLQDCSLADWDRIFALNARAPFLLAQAALPHLHENLPQASTQIALEPKRMRCAAKTAVGLAARRGFLTKQRAFWAPTRRARHKKVHCSVARFAHTYV